MKSISTDNIYHPPFFGSDVAHFVLEPNQKCNLKCTACYKRKEDFTKPLDELKKDIDFAVSKRNLDTISILGGEPTLHPDLPEIIKYISDRGIEVRVLSNGLALTDELLERYKRAGLDILMLHIDSMQNRPDLPDNPTQRDLNELRDKLFNMITRHGIRCGLVITLYKSTLERFVDDFRYVLSSKIVHQMLVTSYFSLSIKHLVESYVPRNEQTENLYAWLNDEENDHEELVVNIDDAEGVVYDAFKLLPGAYISSSKNRNEKRWIFYLLHSIVYQDGSFRLLPLDRRASKYQMAIYQYVHKLIYGRRSFFGRIDPFKGKRTYALLYALSSLNPLYIWKACLSIASSLKEGATFTGKTIFIQRAPNLTRDGELEYCNDCPDATARNGRLIPVCIADVVSPVHLEGYSPEVQEGYRKLLDHLKIEL